MANEENPTTPEKDEEEKDEGASTNTIETLSTIFKGLDGKKIRRIIAVGQAMLQERVESAMDKVLTAHLRAFEDKSCVRQGTTPSVSTLVLSVQGVSWEDAAKFLADAGPTLSEGGVKLVTRLRDLGDEATSVQAPVSMDLEMVLSSEDYAPMMDILDESGISTSEALDYLRSARAKRATGDSPDE